MRKKNGWGLAMMLVLLGILLLFGFIAIYYIYVAHSIGVFK